MTRVTGTPSTPAEYRANACLDIKAALDMSVKDDALRNRKLATVRTQRIKSALKALRTADELERGDAA